MSPGECKIASSIAQVGDLIDGHAVTPTERQITSQADRDVWHTVHRGTRSPLQLGWHAVWEPIWDQAEEDTDGQRHASSRTA